MVILREAGGFVELMEPEGTNSTKRNILATNSSIQEELKTALTKKNIE
jgi:fructose-1,6-bisphosphatase/inositol monophosphatase family enzyme